MTSLTLLAFVVVWFLPTHEAADESCVYTVYVRTGSIWRGGTDSIISAEFYDSDSNSIFIDNLESWGGSLQGLERDYFERGALDIFSGLGTCLDLPICGLNLTSDGSGSHHGWYVNYVEVTSTGAHLACNQHLFTVEQWLATDTYPYTLNTNMDECTYSAENGRARGHLQ